MASERRGGGGASLGWFLLGVVVGAATVRLSTPRRGEQGRDRLGERGTALARRAQALAAEAQSLAGEWLDKSRELFEEQTHRLMGAFEAGREAMREEMRKTSAPLG